MFPFPPVEIFTSSELQGLGDILDGGGVTHDACPGPSDEIRKRQGLALGAAESGQADDAMDDAEGGVADFHLRLRAGRGDGKL